MILDFFSKLCLLIKQRRQLKKKHFREKVLKLFYAEARMSDAYQSGQSSCSSSLNFNALLSQQYLLVQDPQQNFLR